jgi:hypothetical protein
LAGAPKIRSAVPRRRKDRRPPLAAEDRSESRVPEPAGAFKESSSVQPSEDIPNESIRTHAHLIERIETNAQLTEHHPMTEPLRRERRSDTAAPGVGYGQTAIITSST